MKGVILCYCNLAFCYVESGLDKRFVLGIRRLPLKLLSIKLYGKKMIFAFTNLNFKADRLRITMSEKISNLTLKDFKLLPPLLLLNMAGYAFIIWLSKYINTDIQHSAEHNYEACLLFAWMCLWMIISFLSRNGTTFFPFILVWIISSVTSFATIFVLGEWLRESIFNAILIFFLASCLPAGITLLLRKIKVVGSKPASLFAVSTWSPFSVIFLVSLMFFSS